MPTPAEFGQQAPHSGEQTQQTLADILGLNPDSIVEELRTSLADIREVEREAERASAEARLY